MNCIVIAWSEMDGLEKTGRMVLRDANWFPEFQSVPKPRAIVWSRDMKDLDGGQAYARQNGYTCMVLPDSSDVLTIARNCVGLGKIA